MPTMNNIICLLNGGCHICIYFEHLVYTSTFIQKQIFGFEGKLKCGGRQYKEMD